MRHRDEPLLISCKRCGSLFTWNGKPCPGCGAAEWTEPPAELAAQLQAIVARRWDGLIDSAEANRLSLAAYGRLA